jgi:hypothetical protein
MDYTKERLESLKHRWETPYGKKLLKAIKDSKCYITPILFKKIVKKFPGINDEEVSNEIDLRGAPLAGFDFRVEVQEEDDGFSEELAIISNIHFEGANLKHCNFEDGKIHNCNFENADLSHSEFKEATINSCSFFSADLTGANLLGAKLIDCNFSDATIKDMTTTTTIVDQKTTFGSKLKSEKEENFHFASIEYKQIEEMYKNSSLHAAADTFHYKKMVAKRKITKITNPYRILNYIFGDLLCKYGTSFFRVLIASFLVIFICAFFYTTYDSLLYYNTVPKNASFFTSLYFSTGTFTTLGYGDYHAIGGIRFLAVAESFFGATLLSLFTVIVARNIIRD